MKATDAKKISIHNRANLDTIYQSIKRRAELGHYSWMADYKLSDSEIIELHDKGYKITLGEIYDTISWQYI